LLRCGIEVQLFGGRNVVLLTQVELLRRLRLHRACPVESAEGIAVIVVSGIELELLLA
jgi:hypothetical protein